MTGSTFVLRDQLPGLACPWCGRRLEADLGWAVAAQERWGWIGVSVQRHGAVVGVLLVSPAEGTRTALLMCLWVAPGELRVGHGRRLVQAAAAGLLARDVRTLVARGSRHHPGCVAPPRDFLRAVGFTRNRDDRLWRLDLDQTVVDRPSLLETFSRFVQALRPISPPEPAGRTGHVS
jgi:ribosomal protein S18 acetylase RimI-like enzyme